MLVCVFRYSSILKSRITTLSHPQHKFKVDMNAQQYNLSGTAILNPNQCLVVIEGGPKGIKAYKNLMLRRIEWDVEEGMK